MTRCPVVSIVGVQTNTSEATLMPVTFTVTRTSQITSNLVVNYTLYGTAASGSDFIPPSGTVTIPAGSNAVTFAITPLDDGIIECSETVIVSVVAGVNYTISANSSATAVIQDNEIPTVSVLATDSIAAETAANTGNYTIYRTGCTDVPITVNYTLAGTATFGVDYVSLSGTITIPVGSTSTNVIITPIDDAFAEGSETVILTLASGAYVVDGANPASTVTILDNDSLAVAVSPSAIIVPESSSGTFTVALTSQPSTNIVVTVSRRTGSAISERDWRRHIDLHACQLGHASNRHHFLRHRRRHC